MILTIARTFNEENNIVNFIERYSRVCDYILLADGGSTDSTVHLAYQYSNVIILNFPVKIQCVGNKNFEMNPEGEHFNYLIRAAELMKPNWIIYDDVDCYPNQDLMTSGRNMIEALANNGAYKIRVKRYYKYLENEYFPDQTPHASLWTWKYPDVQIRAAVDDPYSISIVDPNPAIPFTDINDPFCLIHNFAPDEESIQAKIKRYAAWGRPIEHPVKRCGKLERLPSWAK